MCVSNEIWFHARDGYTYPRVSLWSFASILNAITQRVILAHLTIDFRKHVLISCSVRNCI